MILIKKTMKLLLIFYNLVKIIFVYQLLKSYNLDTK